MTEIVKIPSMRPEPERDRYGRYVLTDPTTGRKESWTRATTLKDALKDKQGLIGHYQRMAAVGLARKPQLGEKVLQLHEEVLSYGKDWRAAQTVKDALKEVLEELHDIGGGNDASKRGTQAHTLTEYADAGRLDEVRHLATESELADLQAYLDTCDAAGIIRPPRWIERVVINLTVRSAGTFDRLVYLPDGRLVCADVKSQQDFDFGFLDAAAQMGQYVNADAIWNDETRSWEPVPAELDRKTGLIMHVPVGKATCDLIEVDLVEGWESAQIAFDVRLKRAAGKVMGRPYTPPAIVLHCPECTAPDEDPLPWCDCRSGDAPCKGACKQRAHPPYQCPYAGDRILTLIRDAPAVGALEGLWKDLNSRGEWTDVYTRAAAARKAELRTELTAAN